MRVIWVSAGLPHPEAAGARAHEFELIRPLAARHSIEVIAAHIADGLGAEPLDAIGVPSTQVRYAIEPYPSGRAGVALGLVRARPNLVLWSQRHRLAALSDAVREASRRRIPDLVQIVDGGLAPVMAATARPAAILLFDALNRQILSRLAIERLRRRHLKYRLEAHWTRQYERAWYSRASGVATVSSVDAEWLERFLGRAVEVLENPINEGFFSSPTCARSTDLIVFVGSLFYAPNADAIEWFVSEVLPIIRKDRPGVRFRVVGRADASPADVEVLRRRLLEAGVDLRVDVEDVRPHYWEAAVAVAPVRFGAGLRNKVIHAMACGAPVVATPAALEGVPALAAPHALVASTPAAIARAVLETLSRPAESRARAEAAASGVQSLRADRVAERFDAWWKRLAC